MFMLFHGLKTGAVILNSVLDCMDSIGLQVATNVVTYNTLSNDYCKHGRIEEALTLFREMLTKGN